MGANDIRKLSAEELDNIIERTEYAEHGVALGDGAQADQDLRRLAQRELERRYGE